MMPPGMKVIKARGTGLGAGAAGSTSASARFACAPAVSFSTLIGILLVESGPVRHRQGDSALSKIENTPPNGETGSPTFVSRNFDVSAVRASRVPYFRCTPPHRVRSEERCRPLLRDSPVM